MRAGYVIGVILFRIVDSLVPCLKSLGQINEKEKRIPSSIPNPYFFISNCLSISDKLNVGSQKERKDKAFDKMTHHIYCYISNKRGNTFYRSDTKLVTAILTFRNATLMDWLDFNKLNALCLALSFMFACPIKIILSNKKTKIRNNFKH